MSSFGSGVTQMADVGKNLVRGLWNGIQSLATWLWDKVSGGRKFVGRNNGLLRNKNPSKRLQSLENICRRAWYGFIDDKA